MLALNIPVQNLYDLSGRRQHQEPVSIQGIWLRIINAKSGCPHHLVWSHTQEVEMDSAFIEASDRPVPATPPKANSTAFDIAKVGAAVATWSVLMVFLASLASSCTRGGLFSEMGFPVSAVGVKAAADMFAMLPAARRKDPECGWRRLGRPKRKGKASNGLLPAGKESVQ